jgi:hypothetical protein
MLQEAAGSKKYGKRGEREEETARCRHTEKRSLREESERH